MHPLILTTAELANQVEYWHQEQLKLVLTNGCFDLLHIGHIHTFYEAKKLGDILIVGINSDHSVRSLKGTDRPLIGEQDRAQLVAAVKPVDSVTIFAELDANRLIEIIKPHFYVKGGDYNLDNLPEKATLQNFGITVKFIPFLSGNSTSELIAKIRHQKI